MVFHEQFYKVEPEIMINDLVEVKQYKHESTEDFMMRFRRTRIRCQFPINHAQLISIVQKALRLLLRKKLYDVQFNELQKLVIVAMKYEKLLTEEQQVKHSSKVPPFYKNKAPIHQLKFERLEPLCTAEMIIPFKPLMVKRLVQLVKDQKVVMNDGGFVPMKPPKYQTYFFYLNKLVNIYEELVKARVIVPGSTKKMPKPEELRGKKYCKLHYTFNHSIAKCVQFKDWIQDLKVKGKLLLEKPQANMMIDTYSFPEALINMINLNWKGERRQVVRPSKFVVKGVVLCSKCKYEYELEVPASGAKQDTNRSVIRAAEKETSKSLFEVFKNYKAFGKAEDKEAKMPVWIEVKPHQPSYHKN
ncbi:S2-RNase [Pyrus ussuriensis x Pyrus communis]|uniref:S2-RNase n=1 Tax=Pyrus ussuriensis x Pyrus communis TaxID=2448454 RepID=A0A5N5HWP5_9ROSA|nr:S2-RNase [Pyrus ussuriensis x Pyrus communis]